MLLVRNYRYFSKLSMKDRVNTIEEKQKRFDKMLLWLDSDRAKAGLAYEDIRLRLSKLFYARGCNQIATEELVDETIERVTKKIDKIFDDYQGEPCRYFYGVARLVFLEYTRRPLIKNLPEENTNARHRSITNDSEDHQADNVSGLRGVVSPDEDDSSVLLQARIACLEKCMRKLEADERKLISIYYQSKNKIEARENLSGELEITKQNLRIRAFRIRKKLQKCVNKCVNKK